MILDPWYKESIWVDSGPYGSIHLIDASMQDKSEWYFVAFILLSHCRALAVLLWYNFCIMLNHALCSLWTISLRGQRRFRIIGQELRSPIYRDAARPAVEMKETAVVMLRSTVQWTFEGVGTYRSTSISHHRHLICCLCILSPPLHKTTGRRNRSLV